MLWDEDERGTLDVRIELEAVLVVIISKQLARLVRVFEVFHLRMQGQKERRDTYQERQHVLAERSELDAQSWVYRLELGESLS